MKRQVRHIPVMLEQVIEALAPLPGKRLVDCTLGLAGHSLQLLERILPGGQLIGVDMDAEHLRLARLQLSQAGREGVDFVLHHGNFAGIEKYLGGQPVDGLLADLGVASPQIDDPGRGFSYKHDGPLDMRMDKSRGRTAAELLGQMSETELAEAILEYGDESDAPAIARLIVEQRAIAAITTTGQLTALVCQARDFTLTRALGAKLHPAARTFQALRILTNREMANLENLLRVLPACLKPGGAACLISFHSGEDRRIKEAFKAGLARGVYQSISPQPLRATDAQIMQNPRARSAKLRLAVRE